MLVGHGFSLLLLITLLSGWGSSRGWVSVPAHIQLSFAATLGVLFAQTMTVLHLLSVRKRLLQVCRDDSLKPDLLRDMPSTASFLPAAALASATLMAAFVIGGGAHTGVLRPGVHGLTSLLALALQSWSLMQETRALRAMGGAVEAVEGALERLGG